MSNYIPAFISASSVSHWAIVSMVVNLFMLIHVFLGDFISAQRKVAKTLENTNNSCLRISLILFCEKLHNQLQGFARHRITAIRAIH